MTRIQIDDMDAEPPGPDEPRTVGALLRETREQHHLGLDTIEAATHIRAAQLRAIEQDQFDALPAQAYARGFVRSYAEQLGLDADRVVSRFNWQWAETHRPEVVVAPPRSAMRRANPEGAPLTRSLIIVGALFLISAGLLAAAYLSRSGGSHQTQPPASTPAATHTAVAPPPAGTTTPSGTGPAVHRIVFAAAGGPCWIEVRRGSATGAVMELTTLEPGNGLTVRARRVWVRLGDAANATLRVDGRAAHLPATAGPVSLMVTSSGVSQG